LVFNYPETTSDDAIVDRQYNELPPWQQTIDLDRVSDPSREGKASPPRKSRKMSRDDRLT
jgi:hypothetical protein